jgi:hypothetical protein
VETKEAWNMLLRLLTRKVSVRVFRNSPNEDKGLPTDVTDVPSMREAAASTQRGTLAHARVNDNGERRFTQDQPGKATSPCVTSARRDDGVRSCLSCEQQKRAYLLNRTAITIATSAMAGKSPEASFPDPSRKRPGENTTKNVRLFLCSERRPGVLTKLDLDPDPETILREGRSLK